MKAKIGFPDEIETQMDVDDKIKTHLAVPG
jgi:hypothetical protein